MRRFATVHRVPPSFILAGQVGYRVQLACFGWAVWRRVDDSENDRGASPTTRCSCSAPIRQMPSRPVLAAPVGDGRPSSLVLTGRIWVLTGGGPSDSITKAMTSVGPTPPDRRPDRQRTWPQPVAPTPTTGAGAGGEGSIGDSAVHPGVGHVRRLDR